uniref:Uncharacterized protein n=1 Tax=Romanomermis culicivorax TaxID=13658 RepID=A0A915JBP0_ROMCU
MLGRRGYYEVARKLMTRGEQKSEKYITHLQKIPMATRRMMQIVHRFQSFGSGKVHFNLELSPSSSMTNYWGSWGIENVKENGSGRGLLEDVLGPVVKFLFAVLTLGPEKSIKGVSSPSYRKSQNEMMTKPPTRNVGIPQHSDQDKCDTGSVESCFVRAVFLEPFLKRRDDPYNKL